MFSFIKNWSRFCVISKTYYLNLYTLHYIFIIYTHHYILYSIHSLFYWRMLHILQCYQRMLQHFYCICFYFLIWASSLMSSVGHPLFSPHFYLPFYYIPNKASSSYMSCICLSLIQFNNFFPHVSQTIWFLTIPVHLIFCIHV